MPKFLFYVGTGFCLFLALSAAAGFAAQLDGGAMSFVALRGGTVTVSLTAGWSILVALLAGMAVAAILVRMASLLAARNLFGAFVALLSITAAMLTLAWTLLLQSRMIMLARQHEEWNAVGQLHFVAFLMLGCFLSLTFLALLLQLLNVYVRRQPIRGRARQVPIRNAHVATVAALFLSLTFLALRPYFRVQASRVLAALVFFPFPLFCLILIQELFVSTPLQPLPPATPASLVFFAVVALLFFSLGVHCIRHRHMFLEMTNLRELLDSRAHRGLGNVAFDA